VVFYWIPLKSVYNSKEKIKDMVQHFDALL